MSDFDRQLKDIWTSTQTEAVMPDMKLIQKKAQQLEVTVSRRNLREVFAAGIVIVLFLASALGATDPLLQVGAALVAAGAAVVAALIYFRGHSPTAHVGGSMEEFVREYDRELAYQARLLRRVPLWYLGPLAPGMALMTASAVVGNLPVGLVVGGVQAVVFGLVAWLNFAAARQLEARRKALPTF